MEQPHENVHPLMSVTPENLGPDDEIAARASHAPAAVRPEYRIMLAAAEILRQRAEADPSDRTLRGLYSQTQDDLRQYEARHEVFDGPSETVVESDGRQ